MQAFDYNEGEGQDFRMILRRYEGMLAKGELQFLDLESFLRLLEHYEAQGKWEQAFLTLEHALRQHAFSGQLYLFGVQLSLEVDRLWEAERYLAQAKLYEPSSMEVRFFEVEILQQRGHYKQAYRLLDEIMVEAKGADRLEALLMQAVIHEQQERYDKSFELLAELLREDPHHELAYNRIWLAMELGELYAEGAELHQELTDLDPYAPWAWYNLGHAYKKMGLYEKALEAYDYAIVIAEKMEFAYRDYIPLLMHLKQLDRLAGVLVDFEANFPQYPQDLGMWKGQLLQLQGQYAQAQEQFLSLLEEEKAPNTFYLLGVSYAAQGKWLAALDAFEQAFKLADYEERFLLAMAETHNQLNQEEAARNCFQQAAELAPHSPLVWRSYLEFLIDEGDYEQAWLALQSAQLESNADVYDWAAVLLLWQLGQKQAASEQLIMALSTKAWSKHLLFELEPDLEQDEAFMSWWGSHLD